MKFYRLMQTLMCIFTLDGAIGVCSAQDVKQEKLFYHSLIVLLDNEEFANDTGITSQQVSILKSGLAENQKLYQSRRDSLDQELDSLRIKGVSAEELSLIGKKGKEEISKAFILSMRSLVKLTLVPSQLNRFEQLIRWHEINRIGLSGFILTQFKDAKDAPANLKSEADLLQADFERDLLSIKQKYNKRLIDILGEQSQKKLRAAMGEPSEIYSIKIPF